jgi:DNA-binding NtrC family response regulator
VDPVPWGAHLHLSGPRSGGPFIVVDATQPAEREAARWLDPERSPLTASLGGTLLLIEPGSLPTEARDELLRTLARRSDEASPALARPVLIVAGHASAAELAREGALPTWVTNRLADSEIELPGLSERAEDLRALILDGLAHQSLRLGREPLGVDNLALRVLVEHTWPANEIELEAVLARAALIAKGPTIGLAELEAIGFSPEGVTAPAHTPVPAVVKRRVARRFPRGQ